MGDNNWQTTALAMRDAVIWYKETKDDRHLEAVEQMYFDAALLNKFHGMYHKDSVHD
jgi:hypothetical protein